ncbi:MAG: arylesterase [Burkholderiales bacterium]|nr:arylesterase [Burkholderiales bacterium]
MVSGPSGLVTSLVMLSAFRTLILLCLLVVPAAAGATDRTILVFGDSISAGYGLKAEEGWVALLQKRIAAQGYGYRVVNASVSGETTSGGNVRLPRALGLHKPQVLVLELGANDGLRGLPLDVSRRSLASMIEAAQASGAEVLLLGMRIPPNYGLRYTQSFTRMYAELAKEYDVPLVPFFMEKVALDRAMMQEDGLHPTAAAQPLLLDTAWPALRKLLGS